MTEEINQPFPKAYMALLEATKAAGFSMASDTLTCSLLRVLAASKPSGHFLELGTGTGLATSWILDGMDAGSSLISVDLDDDLLDIARMFLGSDKRLALHSIDGGQWLNENGQQRFDYIFADTWHGKYLMLDEALAMLHTGGLYIIDDMLPQPNWPEGHAEKATALIAVLEAREDLLLVKQSWATGILIAVKR